MPGPQPATICLSTEEHNELRQVAARHSTAQQVALRARIVLAAGAGGTNAGIARALDVHIDTVRRWRQRWLDLQPIALADLSVAARLEDLPRPGAPMRISTDQVCQIQALACEKPDESERPISHWSGREIADEAIRRGIVEYISPRHAVRLLKKGACSPTASATG